MRDNLCGTSIQAQGAHLSNNKIKLSDLLNGIKDSTLTPQVINSNGYIDDTLNWTKIEGVFKANGDEEYITIGNFDVRKGLGHIIDPDFNNNGIVDLGDFNTWRSYFRQAVPPAPEDVDINGNGVIDLGDFNTWRSYFRSAPGPGVGD